MITFWDDPHEIHWKVLPDARRGGVREVFQGGTIYQLLGVWAIKKWHDFMVMSWLFSVVICWFQCDFMVVLWWCHSWWFCGDSIVIVWWFYDGFIVIFWWCYECDDFIISFWWFYGDVMVISWWLFGDFNPIHFNGMVYGIRFTLGSINWSRQWLTNMLLAFTVESLNPSLWACW